MKRLRELRKEHGDSQQDVARYLGVTQAALSGWETGKYKIDNHNLVKLAQYFSVSTDYLLGYSNERLAPDNGRLLSERDLRLALFGGEINDDAFQEVKQFVEYIKYKYGKV
ncbi:MAG: helix-turn-helix domain-containing protein [Oscillospiraceae bacterium]